MDKKKNIYYARTYRRIQLRMKISILFACILIIPTLIILVLNIDNITDILTDIGVDILSKVIPPENIQVVSTDYTILNTMKYIDIPTKYPSVKLIVCNLAICLFVLFIMQLFKKNGKPLAVFLMFSIITHVVSCIYFLIAGSEFPYSMGEYSDLYIKQQIGIWFTFIVLAGLVISFMGEKDYVFKFMTFVTILAYSLVFGTVRYILFMFILYRYSVLYMALLFFTVGPMFDFPYFVSFYALFVNKNIKDYEYGDKKGVWKWS